MTSKKCLDNDGVCMDTKFDKSSLLSCHWYYLTMGELRGIKQMGAVEVP